MKLRELLVATEGLALMRELYDAERDELDRRMNEIAELIRDEGYSTSETILEIGAQAGYDLWSLSYDDPGNPIIALEQPAVWSLLEGLAPGRALDAGCGTGRHAARLVELGHDVVGVDISKAMLERASSVLFPAAFIQSDLALLPAPDGAFDLVVCALALAHIALLDEAANELARLVARDGRLIVSVLHPIQVLLGWHAPFADGDGTRHFVREHAHLHSDYLRVFESAGLEMCAMLEPLLTPAELTSKRRASRHIPEALNAAYVGLPGVLVMSFKRRA